MNHLKKAKHGKSYFYQNQRDTYRVQELNEKAPPNIVLTLVGNKVDLAENRAVKKEEAEEYAKSLGLRYHEVSAKQNIGIDALFTEIAKALPKESSNKKKGQVNIKKPAQDSNAGYCSC